MCSYAKSGAPCVPAEGITAVDKIANKCGQSGGNMQPGYYSIPAWYKVCLDFANRSISIVKVLTIISHTGMPKRAASFVKS